MNSERERIIGDAAESASLPAPFVAMLLDDCPWLTGADLMSERIALELLGETANAFTCSDLLRAFVDAYNTEVEALVARFEAGRADAIAALDQILASEGREDDCDDADYAYVEDSLTTRTPIIHFFNDFMLSSEGLRAMAEVLRAYPHVFREVRLSWKNGNRVVNADMAAATAPISRERL